MQQRENTIRNIAWHSESDDNTSGPDAILPILEQATSTWTNVDILTYTPGSTILYQNAYTGCTYDTETYLPLCEDNAYTLSARKARARMITMLEASQVGCLVANRGSCPDYMHNYLYHSTDNGLGSYNNNTHNETNEYDWGYWTMSASTENNTYAWRVIRLGKLESGSTSSTSVGARAVVEITKQ